MDDATLTTDTGRPTLRFERFLPRPLDVVWRAVTDPAEMRSWFPTRVDVERWEPGATFTHHFDDDAATTLPGVVIASEPPRRLVFTWGEDTITFELEPAEGGTRFVLVDELSPAHAARNAAGWEVCLDRLVDGTISHDWATRFEHYSAAFEPSLGAQEGPPSSHH